MSLLQEAEVRKNPYHIEGTTRTSLEDVLQQDPHRSIQEAIVMALLRNHPEHDNFAFKNSDKAPEGIFLRNNPDGSRQLIFQKLVRMSEGQLALARAILSDISDDSNGSAFWQNEGIYETVPVDPKDF